MKRANTEEELKLTPLGAGSEVGRSCLILEFKGKTVMVRSIPHRRFPFYFLQLDCGLHPAHSGLSALPFFDMIDPSSIDLLLITQYVSHCAVSQFTIPVSILTTPPVSLILSKR